MINSIYILISGILMGIADTMPGISGSTVTYILGTYEDFIESLSNILKKGKILQSFTFLLKMGIGWGMGALLSILFIGKIIDSNIYLITSLFLGLVISSIPVTFKESFNNYKIEKKYLLYTVIGFMMVFIFFVFGFILHTSLNIQNSVLLYIYIFFVAIIAISSMLLPGISGSTILLIFGLYYPLINTLKNLISGNFINLSYMIVFTIGAIIGLLFVAKILNRLFKKNTKKAIYLIEGLLIGSMIPIIYAPTTIEGLNYTRITFSNFNILFFVIGIIFLTALINIKKVLRRDNEYK